jgi:hypothetical protein
MLSHVSHAQNNHQKDSTGEHAGQTLIVVARTSDGAIKEPPTLSIHNFSLEKSGLPGSATNPWTTCAWSGVLTRSVMIVTQPVAKMMNSKATMMENLDILFTKVLGKR